MMSSVVHIRRDWRFGKRGDFPKGTKLWRPTSWGEDRVFDREVASLGDMEAWIDFVLRFEIGNDAADLMEARLTSVVSCTWDLLEHLAATEDIGNPRRPRGLRIAGMPWFTTSIVRRKLAALRRWCAPARPLHYYRVRTHTFDFPTYEEAAGYLGCKASMVSRHVTEGSLVAVGKGKAKRIEPLSMCRLNQELKLREARRQ